MHSIGHTITDTHHWKNLHLAADLGPRLALADATGGNLGRLANLRIGD
ncbi:hypothetical protein [Sphingomonas sp. IW22]